MAALAYYGNVQPSEYLEMDYIEAAELAKRVQQLWFEEKEQDYKYLADLATGIAKASAGVRL